jgi:hypothetical protein
MKTWLLLPLITGILALSLFLLWPIDNSAENAKLATDAQANPTLDGWELLPEQQPPADEYEEVSWEALVPPDFNPEKVFENYNVNELADNDPQAIELMKKLKAEWKVAPIVEAMEGRKVKLPGFIVPLETEGERLTEFFLVPYFGACIHVPPPPANQIVLVVVPEDVKIPDSDYYSAIWASGHLSIKRTSNELGDAGYQLIARKIELYPQN